jgi:cell fate regulator YaaT (PSP1 superfamily)
MYAVTDGSYRNNMPRVVGIRFKPATKIYYFDPGDQDLGEGDYVVVETSRARELGEVVMPPQEVPQDEIVGQLKPVLRRATAVDLTNAEYHAHRAEEALKKCQEKAATHGLPIKVISAEYNFDGSCLLVFFTAEQRVDFRDLVKDLARTFRTRIEMRQIGVRDEAKMINGLGPCGRPLCCTTHLCEFIPVSIKMAKQQNLPLSPMEISGLCGRLLCCLTYENEYYQEMQRKMPKEGTEVRTADGVGKVIGHNVIKESVRVELDGGTIVEVPLDQVQSPSRRKRRRRRSQ